MFPWGIIMLDTVAWQYMYTQGIYCRQYCSSLSLVWSRLQRTHVQCIHIAWSIDRTLLDALYSVPVQLKALCGPDCSQGGSQSNQLLSPGELTIPFQTVPNQTIPYHTMQYQLNQLLSPGDVKWSEAGAELIDTPLSPALNWNSWTFGTRNKLEKWKA